MPGKGKIGLSIFATSALMLIVGLLASVATASLPVSTNVGKITVSKVSNQPQTERLSTAPISGPVVVREVKHDTSPPLRDIPPAIPLEKNGERELLRHAPKVPGKQDIDYVVQRFSGPMAMPTPILNFDGVLYAGSTCNCAPPDTNGDIGPNHYVQSVNTAYQVFNKNTGASMFGPVAIRTLWAGFAGVCQVRNDGDPIVKYDQLADRWVINQFTTAPPFSQCIAVSTTGDPMGSYHRYEFQQFEPATRFGDYQKIGVWPDAYYMSNNEFNAAGTAFLGAGNYAFDRTKMLAGLPASYVYFGLPPENWGGQQPSDLDGANLPPVGAPNLFVEIDDSAWDPPNIPSDQMQMWRFHVDFVTPANSSFTPLPPFTPPTLAAFDGLLCNFGDCVPQPGTSQRLDTISDRVMYRVAYRNFGTHESIVFNHTVDAGTDKSAIRWYELRGINTTPSIFQQGTYDPDANHHWMGSIAQDIQGNMALGYSVASASLFPSIRYTGRLVEDPVGTLPQGEATIINGTGSQTGTNGRWGDYSSISVDPVDDCTFWYTQEYYSTTGSFNWRTRIGNFKYPGCTLPVQATPTATIAPPTVTRTATRTATARPTNTPGGPTETPEPTATSTPCTITFSDVSPSDYFYTPVEYLYCQGVISGYADNTFRPYNNTTRSQMVKIVVLGFGITIVSPSSNTFADVLPGTTFYEYVESAAANNIVSGYPCGGETEPCDSENRPYFRPYNNVTRGQLSKIDVVAAGWPLVNPPSNTFTDVLPGTTFYEYVETVAAHGVVGGYECGGPGEPCDSENRPYFRQYNDAIRGQIAKIVYLSITNP